MTVRMTLPELAASLDGSAGDLARANAQCAAAEPTSGGEAGARPSPGGQAEAIIAAAEAAWEAELAASARLAETVAELAAALRFAAQEYAATDAAASTAGGGKSWTH